MIMEVVLLSMKSPGGQKYQFSMEKTEENLALLRDTDKRKMNEHLQQLKKSGLKALKEPSNQTSIRTTTKTVSSPLPQDECQKPTMECSSQIKQISSQDHDEGDHNDEDNPYMEPEDEEGPMTIGFEVLGSNNRGASRKPVQKKTQKHWKTMRVQDIVNEEKVYNVERRVLEEVLKRPALYNFRLDLKDSPPDLKFKLYSEVAEIVDKEFGLTLPTIAVENTWNQYRLLYIQYANRPKLKSGSGTSSLPRIPKHYEIMVQLDFMYKKRKQTSTTSAEGFELIPPKKKRNKTVAQDDISPLIKSATDLFTSLNEQSTSTTSAQPVSSIASDPHLAFYHTMLPKYKILKKRDKREFEIKVLSMLNDYINSYETDDSSD